MSIKRFSTGSNGVLQYFSNVTNLIIRRFIT